MTIDNYSRITCGNIEEIIGRNQVNRIGFVILKGVHSPEDEIQYFAFNTEHDRNISELYPGFDNKKSVISTTEGMTGNPFRLSSISSYLRANDLYLANAHLTLPEGEYIPDDKKSIDFILAMGDLYIERKPQPSAKLLD